jgi:hypothetical protein
MAIDSLPKELFKSLYCFCPLSACKDIAVTALIRLSPPYGLLSIPGYTYPLSRRGEAQKPLVT